jgi:hypothetical protein
MKKKYDIINNYLLLKSKNDFTDELLKYFYERLCMFLCVELDEEIIPTIIFSGSHSILDSYYGQPLDSSCRAFFDENSLKVVLDSKRYSHKKKTFMFELDEIKEELPDIDLSKYNYIIPLSDLYHELIHAIQYDLTDYEDIDMLEGLDDIYSYFITGQYNIDYIKETLSIWYIARKLLKLSKVKFYIFIRNSIVDSEYYKKQLLNNKQFVLLLADQYNGNLNKFLEKFKNDFYDDVYENEFRKDLLDIHHLIFYKY